MHMVYKENYSHIKHKPQSFYCLLCFCSLRKLHQSVVVHGVQMIAERGQGHMFTSLEAIVLTDHPFVQLLRCRE